MEIKITEYDILDSTNDTAKELAAKGAAEGTVIVAAKQTAGRGRGDHKFYSPTGGLYMSVILRPRFTDCTLITPAAAVSVCRALDRFGFKCLIKWVNDIYKDDKKVCGILAESNVSDGWVTLGIGINTVNPGKNAPDIAGYLYEKPPQDVNEKLLHAALEEFDRIYSKLPDTAFIGYYRERSYLKGKRLEIRGEEFCYAGIDGDFGLIVKNENGTKKFRSGEVSAVIRGFGKD